MVKICVASFLHTPSLNMPKVYSSMAYIYFTAFASDSIYSSVFMYHDDVHDTAFAIRPCKIYMQKNMFPFCSVYVGIER